MDRNDPDFKLPLAHCFEISPEQVDSNKFILPIPGDFVKHG